MLSQKESFPHEMEALRSKRKLPRNCPLLYILPYLDKSGILRVGGRLSNSSLPHDTSHPIILHGKHRTVKLIIRSEHIRLLHAGPTLTVTSLGNHFHINSLRATARTMQASVSQASVSIIWATAC